MLLVEVAVTSMRIVCPVRHKLSIVPSAGTGML